MAHGSEAVKSQQQATFFYFFFINKTDFINCSNPQLTSQTVYSNFFNQNVLILVQSFIEFLHIHKMFNGYSKFFNIKYEKKEYIN